MITASATAAEVTYDVENDKVFTNVFRTCFIDPFQGEKMADYAAEVLNAKTAAVIYQNGNDYSTGLTDAFVAKCATLGVEIVGKESYPEGDKDFKAQMTNIAAKNPDVVFCPNYVRDVALIVPQAREVGVKSVFLGGDGWANLTTQGEFPAADFQNSVFTSAYAPGSTDEVKAFEDAYKAKYGADTLNMFAATAYDAAMVLVNALKVVEAKGGMTPGSDEYKQAVIDAIRDDSGDVKGITSPEGYAFDDKNNPIKAVVMLKIVDGVETFDRLY